MTRPRRALAATVLVTALAMGSSLALADPGDPDAGFGTSGVVTTDTGGTQEGSVGVAHQSDGSIVVLAADEGSGAITLVRYEPGGTLDAGFGTGGILVLPALGIDLPSHLLIGGDDSMVVVGSVFEGTEYDLLVWKLDAGDPDTFADDDGSLFERDIEALAASGITRGCATDSFCPDDAVTREQMASFLVRALARLDG